MGLQRNAIKPNRLGVLTELNYNMGIGNCITADFSLIVQDPGAVHELFQEWINGGMSAPTYQKEYMCLYCATPNNVEHSNCKKCGAPRSFVLG